MRLKKVYWFFEGVDAFHNKPNTTGILEDTL